MAGTETAAVVLQLSAVAFEEDGLWIAGCPSLDVFTQGDSEENAKAGLEEAVELWIDSCLERNSLGEALRELGWYRIQPGAPAAEGTDLFGAVEAPWASRGHEYPLEVRIPAYQAALLSGDSKRAHR